MDVEQYIKGLEQFAAENQEYEPQITKFMSLVLGMSSEKQAAFIQAFLCGNTPLQTDFRKFMEKRKGLVFWAYEDYPPNITKRLDQAASNEHLRIWVDTVKSVPRKTAPIYAITGIHIKKARTLWEREVCGNEKVLNVLLRHDLEYGLTGRTQPILLAGPPGVGKTLIANVYSKLLGLPGVFISGPSASVNRGLAGSPNLYVGAGAGEIVQAMIKTGIANPVLIIDELDKALGGYNGSPSFQNELLAALDDSNVRFRDNYLEFELDCSHIPYIFTANDISRISAPLLDRMEVIQLEPPSKEMLYEITQKHVLPELLQRFHADRICVTNDDVSALVDRLWNYGTRSCRPYKKAMQILIGNAYLKAVEQETSVCICKSDIAFAADNMMERTNKIAVIGFQ